MYRYSQHLACRSDDSNESKNGHIQELLAQGKTPVLYKIEEVSGIEQGRAREQYWIRYAISKGANLLNRAITYTDAERTRIHQERAIRYAEISAILAQGIYVKRYDGNFYPPRMLDPYACLDGHVRLIDLIYVGFKNQSGVPVSVDTATDAEFDTFIHQYVRIHDDGDSEWSLEERRDVIEYAMFFGARFEFCDPPPDKRMRRRKQ